MAKTSIEKNKNTAKKDVTKKDVTKKDVTKDTAKKDTAKKDTAKKDTAKKDTAKKDTAVKKTTKTRKSIRTRKNETLSQVGKITCSSVLTPLLPFIKYRAYNHLYLIFLQKIDGTDINSSNFEALNNALTASKKELNKLYADVSPAMLSLDVNLNDLFNTKFSYEIKEKYNLFLTMASCDYMYALSNFINKNTADSLEDALFEVLHEVLVEAIQSITDELVQKNMLNTKDEV